MGLITMASIEKASSRRSPRMPPMFRRATRRSSRKNMPMPYSLHVSVFRSYAIVNDLKWQHFHRGETCQKGKPETLRVARCLKASGVGKKNRKNKAVAGSTFDRCQRCEMQLPCKSLGLVLFGAHYPCLFLWPSQIEGTE